MSPRRKMKRQLSRPARAQQDQLDYNQLEARQLLAFEFTLNFTGTIFPTDSAALVPDVQSEITADYAVEVANGRFLVHNRFTGTRVMSKSLEQFFSDAGSTIFTTAENPRVVFDEASERFFVAAIGEGSGNWIHVAFSETSDPTGLWQSLQFVGDSTAVHYNGDLSLAVDADAVYLTTNNYHPSDPEVIDNVSIYSIPKSDFFLSNPTLTNMTRFEALAPDVFGTTIQVASNFEASDGKAIALGSLTVANKTFIEILGADGPGATLAGPFEFNVDFGLNDPTHLPEIPHDEGAAGAGEIFREPDSPYQEGNEDLALVVKHGFTGSIQEINGSIFAVQTISFEDIEDHTSLNWFEVDVDSRAVAGSTPVAPLEEIENNIYQASREGAELDPFAVALRGPASHVIRPEAGANSFNYLFNPSIAVTEAGYVAISYNRVSASQPIGTGLVVGTTVNGIERRNIQLEDDAELQGGFSTYDLDTQQLDPWGFRSSVVADPLNPNGFFVSQPWANTTDRWTVQNSLIELVDMNPIIEADVADNMIVVRRSATDADWLEVEIDGVVTDTFYYDSLGKVEIWADAGDDHFLIDYTNGDPTPEGGFLFDGADGIDTVETNDPVGSTFEVIANHPTFGNNYPDYLFVYQTRFGDDGTADGYINETSDMVDVEELLGGPGNDTFVFTDNATLKGSANGRGGDDTFQFIDLVTDPISDLHSGVEESIIGGPGYDTLDFELRSIDTSATIVGFGDSGGFNGRLLPADKDEVQTIGGVEIEEDDLFLEIENIKGSSLHENDSLVVFSDLAGEWWIDDEQSHYVVMDEASEPRQLDFFQWNLLEASVLRDAVNVRSNSVSPLEIETFDGDDEFIFSSTAPALDGHTDDIGLLFLDAGEGANQIKASHLGGSTAVTPLVLRNRVTGLGDFVYETSGGGTFDMELWGSPFDDFISLHSYFNENSLKVWSGAGNDEFSIQDLSKASIEIYGEAGDDTYVLQQVAGVSFRNLSIIDSVGAESDAVFLAGTSASERFLITSALFVDINFEFTGIEILGVDGLGGDDIFEILDYDGDLSIRGGDGNDSFFFASDGELLEGDLSGFGNTNITVDGEAGTNHLAVSNKASTDSMVIDVRDGYIEGLWNGRLNFDSTGGRFDSVDGFSGIWIRGSESGNNRMDARRLNADDSLTFEAFDGNDVFFARGAAMGNIRMMGASGDDNHNVVFGESEGRVVDIVEDGTAINRLNFFGTDNDDSISVFGDRVESATELATISGNFQTLTVLARDGHDQMGLAGSPALITRFFGENGNDVFQANGSDGIKGLRVLMGDGQDEVHLVDVRDTTFTQIEGNEGDDLIAMGPMAKGSVIADGQEGSDQYEIGLTGDTARYIRVLDSGIGENDALAVTGTDDVDELQIRTRRINRTLPAGSETIVYNGETEMLTVHTGQDDDVVDFFGSTAFSSHIQTEDGQDVVNIHSTTLAEELIVDGGANRDKFTVLRVSAETDLTIDGGSADDQFYIGSSEADDNGNLGLIRGQIQLRGGTSSPIGGDSIYINDRVPTSGYAYHLSENGLLGILGPNNILRPTFQGIHFESMEFVRFDASDGANYIELEASQITNFHIDGNEPASGVGEDVLHLLGQPSDDGRELTITDPLNGDGFYEFDDGSLDIIFENIEETIDGI